MTRRLYPDSGAALAVTLAMVALAGTITGALVERAHMTLRDIDARMVAMQRRDTLDAALRAAIATGDCVTTRWAIDTSMPPVVVSCQAPEADPASIETYTASGDGRTGVAAAVRRDTDGRVEAWWYVAD